MQTKRGVDAKGPTEEEFRDFIKVVKQKYISRCKKAGVQARPIFSWDNPRIHGSVKNGTWDDLGITTTNFMSVPCYSPDMHNVIETSHAVICQALRKDVQEYGAGQALEFYMQKLEQHFYKLLTVKWARRTVKRLFAVTLPAILERGGAYPPKRAR